MISAILTGIISVFIITLQSFCIYMVRKVFRTQEYQRIEHEAMLYALQEEFRNDLTAIYEEKKKELLEKFNFIHK